MNKELIIDNLERIFKIANTDEPDEGHGYPLIKLLANQALALLKQPECKTCGDKPRGVPARDGGWIPCPDCKPKPDRRLHYTCPKCGKLFPKFMGEEFRGHVTLCQEINSIEQKPPSDFTKKIRERWLGQAPHTNSTLDYAICAILDLCDRLDSAVAACEIGLQIGEWIGKLSNRPKALAEDIETIKAAIAQSKQS